MTTATRTRVVLRSCNRCKGDLFLDEDGYACIQCGHRVTAVMLDAGSAGALTGSSMSRGRQRPFLLSGSSLGGVAHGA